MRPPGYQFIRVLSSRLPLASMLTLLLALGLLPALFLGNMLIKQERKDIEFSERELAGAEFLRAAWPAYTMATDARTPAVAQQRAKEIKSAFIAAAKTHSPSLDANKETEIVIRSLQAAEQGLSGSPITGVDTLISAIGDKSNLILDPELDTYYLTDVVLEKLRNLNDIVAEIADQTDPVQADIHRAELGHAVEETKASLRRAINGNRDGSLKNSKLMTQMRDLEFAIEAEGGFVSATGELEISSYRRARDRLWVEANTHLTRLIQIRVENLRATMNRIIIMTLAIIGLVIIGGALLIRSLSAGLAKLTYRLQDLSEGDNQSEVPGTDLHNDIGVIARALEDFIARDGEREALAEQLTETREQGRAELETKIAQINAENKRLRAKEIEQQLAAQEAERRTIKALATELENRVSGLLGLTRDAALDMNKSSGAMQNIASQSFDSTGSANEAANRIQNTVDQLIPRISAIAGTLRTLRERSDKGRSIATSAIERIDLAAQRMDAFATSADQIDEMQAMIVSVANQTNMLALNASIEAMRVGEAGEGFMVVANEVKSLSNSTAQAAFNIGSQIADMRSANDSVIAAFESILQAMRDLAQSALTVSDGIAEQTDGITDVEDAIIRANDTVAMMTNGISGATTAAREARDTSGVIAQTCTRMVDQLATLDSTIANFTDELKRTQAAA